MRHTGKNCILLWQENCLKQLLTKKGMQMMTNSKQSPYQWVTNRDGYRTLLRTKHPRLAIEVQDDADCKQIADALKKAAEFVMKENRIL